MREITIINDADIMCDAITKRLGASIQADDGLKAGILDGLTEINKSRQQKGPEAVTMLAVKRRRGWFKRARK